MRYSGIECVSCNNIFDEKDDVVVCPVCGAPHHRECWMKENRCAYNDRHQEGFVWEFPKTATNKQAETNEPKTVGDFVFKNGEGVIICPECKTPNFANDAFCRRCHKPFTQNNMNVNQNNIPDENQTPYNQNINNNYSDNQYSDNQQPDYGQQNRQYASVNQDNAFLQESLNRFGGLNPESTIDSIPVVEYSDYIGGNAPGKIIRKISFLERYGKKFIIHWPPILLGPVWFFYRKMAKEGLIASLILLLCSIICCFTSITAPFVTYSKEVYNLMLMYMSQEISQEEYIAKTEEAYSVCISTNLSEEDTVKNYIALVTNYASSFGVNLVCALLSIKLYRQKIKKDIFRTRTQCNDMYTYRNRLIAKGGTSPALAIVGVIIFAAASLIRTTLPMILAIMAY